MLRLKRISWRTFGLLLLLPVAAAANVLVNGTRVIYPQNQREVGVQLNNDSNLPSLVQAWIDKGDPEQDLSKINAPFVLLPPIFRMEPHTGQTLRLTWTGEALPTDRESVFWLNVLDIPPKNAALTGSNTLQMAIRTRIKIFFRPTGLTAEGAVSAARQLHWQTVTTDPRALRLDNPSPYFINLSRMVINMPGKTLTSLSGEMIPPLSSATVRMDQPVGRLMNPTISYHIINDYGSETTVDIKPTADRK